MLCANLLLAVAASLVAGERELSSELPTVFAKAAAHYRALDAAATPRMGEKHGKIAGSTPHSWDVGKNALDMTSVLWWTSGHFPGALWYLYEATGDAFFRERALVWTKPLAPNAKVTDNHDVGFVMNCSYGNARRLLKTAEYDALLVETAHSLCQRFHPGLGLIRSWGPLDGKRDFRVIPDNLMNLELLEVAASISGERRFDEISRSHANVTLRNHFREDGGCYHVLDYDQKTGRRQGILRGQGVQVGTAWSRGQSWAIYGYAMMYRFTKDPAYLAAAEKFADYAIDHPNMPADGVPYWDYGAPGEERDTSAASVMASALLELCTYADGKRAERYRAFAVRQLRSLCTDAYFAAPGEIGGFILKHGVGNKPGGKEIDVPLDYGDYYFLEALVRFRDLAARAPLVETPLVDAGHVPERLDDFFWENDRFAMRVYGFGVSQPRPKGEGLVSSGIDVFNKNVTHPILRQTLKGPHSYHATSRVGFDNYKVSTGRGVGGICEWKDGAFARSGNWTASRILEKAADKVVFELDYADWGANGAETRRGTLKAGENFIRLDVKRGRRSAGVLTGPGIDVSAARQHNGDVRIDLERGIVSNWEPDVVDKRSDGPIATAIVFTGKVVQVAKDEKGCLCLLGEDGDFTYYAGATWSGNGDFKTAEAWHAYVRDFAEKVRK